MDKEFRRRAQELQAKIAKVDEQLANTVLEAKAGGGAVTIFINGKQKVEVVKISPEVVDPQDIGLLEDLVLTAMNEAVEKTQELAQKYMSEVTPFKIPGIT